jgi:hypothetical protein
MYVDLDSSVLFWLKIVMVGVSYTTHILQKTRGKDCRHVFYLSGLYSSSGNSSSFSGSTPAAPEPSVPVPAAEPDDFLLFFGIFCLEDHSFTSRASKIGKIQDAIFFFL